MCGIFDSVLNQSIGSLCRRYQVKELALFGSAARGELRLDSDLDFLVEFEEGVSVGFLTMARLQAELSSLVQRSVDLVPKGVLKPSIRSAILEEAEVLYEA